MAPASFSATEVDDQFAASDFAQTLAARGIPASIGKTGSASFTVELLRLSDPMAQQRLTAANLTFDSARCRPKATWSSRAGNAVTIIAASPEGAFYGLQTLKQMITFNNGVPTLNAANIRDWPAMRYRGVHDDLSRGPIPTLDFQKHQIQTFAAYKINIYSPYFENTLAYTGSPLAAPPGGSLTPDDVAQLVAFAKAISRHHRARSRRPSAISTTCSRGSSTSRWRRRRTATCSLRDSPARSRSSPRGSTSSQPSSRPLPAHRRR